MADLREAYKKKFEAAEQQQDSFQASYCYKCDIREIGNSTRPGNFCKYFIFSKVELSKSYDNAGNEKIASPLSLLVINAGCQLITDKPLRDRSGEQTEYCGIKTRTALFSG